MYFHALVLLTSLLPILRTCRAQQGQVVIPAPNGSYTVGRSILTMINYDSVQLFAPSPMPPKLEISVYYPTDSETTVNVQYMPPETALFEDIEQRMNPPYGLNTPNGTFERLVVQLAPNGTSIAQPQDSSTWQVLLFGAGEATTRWFYSTLASQIASTGYVVILYDTPYDTDIVQYSDGTFAYFNQSITLSAQSATADVNLRAQDTSYILNQFFDSDFASSNIPGCTDCLNTTHAGMLGHSLGGATAATVMLNDTRIAGGLDFDGALWGPVIQSGLTRPFMLMATTNQTRLNVKNTPDGSWFTIWPRISAPKFDVIIDNSLHYTYSDLPLICELLGILPANATILEQMQLTTMNGTRAHYIVTTYATTFFHWLFKGGSKDLLESASPAFPEVVYDDGTAVAGNGSSTTSGGAVSSATANANEGGRQIGGGWVLAKGVLDGVVMVCAVLM